MKIFNIILAVLTISMIGCSTPQPQPEPQPPSLIDLGKDFCCVKENGAYTGAPKPEAVLAVTLLVKKGAELAGFPVDDNTAKMVAEEALKALCSGKVDELPLSLSVYSALKKQVGEDKALKILVKMY